MFIALLMLTIFFAAFILTMVGLGGGLVYSPLLLILGYPVATAVSVSLFLNGIAALSAGITYHRKKMMDFQTAGPLLVTSALAAPVGALMTSVVNPKIFSGIMIIVLFLAAIRMFSKADPPKDKVQIGLRGRIIGGGAIGIAVGLMGGLLGIGGGVFIVPLLIFGLKMPARTAAATSIFIVVFSSFSGFLAHVSIAGTDWHLLLPAAVFSFAGGQLGSRIMSAKLKGQTVRRIFSIVLIVFCLKLMQNTFL